MYKIKVISYFSAAHFLRNYKGKCESLHGHNWKVEVEISKEKLNSSGFIMDFGELKEKLNKVLEKLDHKVLNEIEYFKERNPTSEELAFYTFSQLKKILPQDCKLIKVSIWEKEDSCATYEEKIKE